ncbi:DUF2779 domain-containing protein [Gammaproteobacteria bacterium]|nr:DUF2779 domain-containing protein [Gammaproteobacteria bacterium]
MLSKSKFILGQQCKKALWFDAQGHEPTNPADESAIERLRAGNEVGEFAKKIFPNGVDIEYFPNKSGFQKMCDLTTKAIESGATSIYEASFMEDGIFIRVDIMNLTSEGWNIYEVKSSSRVRSYHKEDASLQWHVLKKVKGLALNDVFVIFLNNEYLKKGDVDVNSLFEYQTSLTDFVESNQDKIRSEIQAIKLASSGDVIPVVNIGSHCKKPHTCQYLDKCWPERTNDLDSIFRLYRLNFDKKLIFYNDGIDSFKKITSKIKLSTTQQNQIKAYKTKEPIIDISKINTFISSIEYPISYFDFETFTDAVPLYEGQRPHMQMPFQYSLHVQESREDDLSSTDCHFEFIGNIEEDPRRAIAERMLKDIPKSGSIMAYNHSFEKNCIKSLASHCPDISSELLSLNERFVDLIDPFRGGGYYDHKFGGSFSIKSVLPALCPNDDKLNYKNLDINNGAMASSAYKSMRTQPIEQITLTREMLFKYCWLDTYAMYAIYTKLLELTK